MYNYQDTIEKITSAKSTDEIINIYVATQEPRLQKVWKIQLTKEAQSRCKNKLENVRQLFIKKVNSDQKAYNEAFAEIF